MNGLNILSRVKPRHLQLVLEIAETEQLQLAAQSLAISQPAASRILADLESTFGSPLFERHPLGMVPTPAGEIFARHARVMLSELETMTDELAHLAEGASGTVRVGAVTGPAIGYLMPAVQSVLESYPDLNISVDVAPSSTLFRRLKEARYDFIVGRTTPDQDKSEYRFYPAPAEVVALVVHETHPLAGDAVVDLAATGAYPWVIQEEGSPIRMAVEDAFLRQNVAVPTRILNSSSLLVVLSQVAGGQSIAPQTEEVANLLGSPQVAARLVTLTLREPIVVAPYFIIRSERRSLSRAAGHLLHEVLSRI